jgi:hypothetical protein
MSYLIACFLVLVLPSQFLFRCGIELQRVFIILSKILPGLTEQVNGSRKPFHRSAKLPEGKPFSI